MGGELISLRRRAIAANQGEPAQRRHDTPQEAREFRDLSMAIYDSDKPLPAGYEEVPNAEQELGVPLKDPETGLDAKVYRKGDTYVLVFEGTTSDDNGTDWGANIGNGVGGVPKQYRQALDIALRFKQVYGSRGDVVVTGHSLGGGLATFAGVVTRSGVEAHPYVATASSRCPPSTPGRRRYEKRRGIRQANRDSASSRNTRCPSRMVAAVTPYWAKASLSQAEAHSAINGAERSIAQRSQYARSVKSNSVSER